MPWKGNQGREVENQQTKQVKIQCKKKKNLKNEKIDTNQPNLQKQCKIK